MKKGDRYKSKAFGHELVILDILEYPFVKVEFLKTGRVVTLRRCNIRSLQFRDCYQPTLHDIGIVGEVKVRVDGKLLASYVAWTSLLERCYRRGGIKERVCEEWLYFPNFMEWFDENVPEGWFVDKDYKYLGNCYYSPSTCTPLPCELNSLLAKSIEAKGFTPTRGGGFDSRVRVGRNKTVRKTFKTKKEALRFYINNKCKYIEELRVKYRDRVPDYVFDNAIKLIEDKYR